MWDNYCGMCVRLVPTIKHGKITGEIGCPKWGARTFWQKIKGCSDAIDKSVTKDMYEALSFFVSRSDTEYAYLDRGIGTSTKVGKSFLQAREVIVKVNMLTH